MSAPAQRSVQGIAVAAAEEILALNYPSTPAMDNLSAIVRRAIVEALKAVDARIEWSVRNDLHEASRIVRASASGSNFADTFCLANRIGFIADALDEIGRAAK